MILLDTVEVRFGLEILENAFDKMLEEDFKGLGAALIDPWTA